MDKQNVDEHRPEVAVKIDYEHLDVAQIMSQIKKIAAEKPRRVILEEPSPAEIKPELSFGLFPAIPPATLSFKQKIRIKIAKLMKPFFPLIRLLALPIHEELTRTIEHLHETNQRVDYLFERLAERDVSKDYIKLLHNLSHNLVVELTKLKIEEETLKSKTRILEKDLESLTKREKALEKKVFK